jgi:preprotein translocase subunit SecE
MKWLKYFFAEFLPEVIVEMKKVSFPSRDEVVGTTIVVIVTSFIFALYLWAADMIILKVYQGVFDASKRLLS